MGRWMPIVGSIVCVVVVRASTRGDCLGRVCSAALPALVVADPRFTDAGKSVTVSAPGWMLSRWQRSLRLTDARLGTA